MAYEFRLPDIGEGLHEAEILNWFVSVGDVIAADQNVVEVQTDKAAVEIASPVGGKVLQLGGNPGALLKVGELLLAVDTTDSGSVARASSGIATEVGSSLVASEAVSVNRVPVNRMPANGVPVNAVAPEATQSKRVLAAPAVRKLARDLGVDLTQVVPSDARGHVSRVDVEQYLEQVKANLSQSGHRAGQTQMGTAQARNAQTQAGTAEAHKSPSSSAVVPDRSVQTGFAAQTVSITGTDKPGQVANIKSSEVFEAEERQPIRGLRKKIYENMMKSMSRAPQATGMDELDMSRLVEVRKRMLPYAEARSIKLTYLPFIIKAVTHVLQENPIFNASVDDENMEIVYKKHIHIGFATATPEGLLVPVIRHANHKSVFEIAEELEDLSRRGRERKLKLEELSASTFTISNTGAHGGWFATPILNYPEVAILGVHSIAKKAVVLEDDSIVAKHMMGFSLSFDHRVIDGEPVGAFMNRFKEILENPELLMVL